MVRKIGVAFMLVLFFGLGMCAAMLVGSHVHPKTLLATAVMITLVGAAGASLIYGPFDGSRPSDALDPPVRS